MICPGCGCESFGAVFTGEGPKHKCNGCGNLFALELIEQTHVAPLTTEHVEPAKPQRVATQPITTISTPGSLLKNAKARVRELTKEINRLKSLTKERDELRRLIAAAKQPRPSRTATVRHLRATGDSQ